MLHDIALGIIIGTIFVSLVVLFCAIIIKLYIQKIKKYNAMIYQNEIDFQKTLNKSLVESHNQLLHAISQELHDDAGQQLTVINFQIENLKLDHPSCDEDLKPISESVVNLSHSLRHISHSLNNSWLQKNGLILSIEHEIKRLKKNKVIQFDLKINEVNNRFLNSEIEIVLFRIFQESINNILKHAKASKIKVTVTATPYLIIKIEDNGIGFEMDKVLDTNPVGIQNCIDRAKLINYNYIIHSETNKGTTIMIEEKPQAQNQ